MEQKRKENATVLSQREIAPDIYDMWIGTSLAGQGKPGQFIVVYPKAESTLLPRPISICEIDRPAGALRIVYRTAGEGTREFSEYGQGESVDILGPLGNGFPEVSRNKEVFLIGGGIGIPPMLELAKSLTCKKSIILGYRDTLFLNQEFEAYGDVYVATEDGSAGSRGNVLDAVRDHGLKADMIMACGPTPMLKAIKAYAEEHHMECYLSLEEKMACGVGACLACVCQTKEVDHHSNVHNRRICKDGPVFRAEEVIL